MMDGTVESAAAHPRVLVSSDAAGSPMARFVTRTPKDVCRRNRCTPQQGWACRRQGISTLDLVDCLAHVFDTFGSVFDMQFDDTSDILNITPSSEVKILFDTLPLPQ